MWSLKNIHRLGAGPCNKPFETLTVLGDCSRTIFHSACKGHLEMLLRSASFFGW